MSFSIKEAYKQSEFGLIPSNWYVSSFEDVTLEHKQGYYTKEAYTDNGVRLLRITDLKNPKVLYENSPFLIVSDKEYDQFKVEPGDFLFARSGAIGRYGIVPSDISPSIFASYLIRFKFDTSKVVREFLGLFYESEYGQNQISKITQGSSNININANNIKTLKLPLPPLREQQKITEILSATDEQIEKTEQLIEKTKELKKGLMQNLFTKGVYNGEFKNTELGDVPVRWNVELIDKVAIRKSGHTPNKKVSEYWSGEIPWISLKDISRLDKRYVKATTDYVSLEGIKNSSAVILPPGTVIVSRDATVGKIGITEKEMATSQHFINYICSEELNNIYLYYYFLYKKDMFIRIAAGSTIKTIGLDFFKKLKIIVPPIEEQQKIADILFSIDIQIETYEKENEKQIELKKALMQQLLTGEIRVTV